MGAKYLSNERRHRRRLDVTDDHEDRVGRVVVRLEEGLHLVQRGGLDVGQVAVEVVRVEPVHVGELRHVDPREAAVGSVETATRTRS